MILILYRLGLGFLFVVFHFTYVPTARFSGCSAGVPGFNMPVVFAFIWHILRDGIIARKSTVAFEQDSVATVTIACQYGGRLTSFLVLSFFFSSAWREGWNTIPWIHWKWSESLTVEVTSFWSGSLHNMVHQECNLNREVSKPASQGKIYALVMIIKRLQG